MTQEFALTELDALFEEKVYVIADEVLNILKEFSEGNRQQISTKEIAEKMFWRKPVKDILHNNDVKPDESRDREVRQLKEVADAVLNRFSELVPESMVNHFSDLPMECSEDMLKSSTHWLDSPIGVIKRYINSLSMRITELESFMIQTMQYLSDTEYHISSELSSQQEKFDEDRNFENNITSSMDYLKENVNTSNDFSKIKIQLLNKIDNINKGINIKREQDMKRLQETERTIESMSKRMSEIKEDADEIRRRSQEIEFEAVRDGLTGLYNRKAYNEKIEETLAHVRRYDIKASLMICDIDYFKTINDTFGHKVGDLALKKLASLLKERLRSNDFISRYGGEEFVIILPHTDIKGALKAGEGIRSYIDKSIFSYKSQTIPLTISVGISSFMRDDNESTVFERADKALYTAKRSGRNSVRTEEDNAIEGSALNKPVFLSHERIKGTEENAKSSQ